MPEISDLVSVAYPKLGAVVSSVGGLFVVQDLQGRVIEVALTTSVRGGIELCLASSASVKRRVEQKAKGKRATQRKARRKVGRIRVRMTPDQKAASDREKKKRWYAKKNRKPNARERWAEMRRLAALAAARKAS